MHPTERRFLDAVCDDPSDDAPRLALADWWMEHGQHDRGEFVLVQIELKDDPPCEVDIQPTFCNDGIGRPFPCRPCKLRRRERELRFVATAMLYDSLPLMTWCAKRGFASEVSCLLSDWMTHGPKIVKDNPIEEVDIQDWEVRILPEEFGYLDKPRLGQIIQFDAQKVSRMAINWARREAGMRELL